MRFLRISEMHYDCPRIFPYLQHEGLAELPYDFQLNAILSYFFHYSDSLSVQLRSLGYEAKEVIVDVEPLQKRWALENGVYWSESHWRSEILIKQILNFKPDIIYFHNAFFSHSLILECKKIFPFLRTLVLFRGYPEMDRVLYRSLSVADLLLVGSPVLEKQCRDRGLKPHLFHHYFDDRVLSCIQKKLDTRIYPFTFLGSSGVGCGWNHQPRYYFLSELLKRTSLECWMDEVSFKQSLWKEKVKRKMELFGRCLPQTFLKAVSQNCTISPFFRKLAFNAFGKKISLSKGWNVFPDKPLSSLYPDRCREPLFGQAMYQVLASSLVTFNKHALGAFGTVDNIRLFEGTGVGSCLLTDRGSNLSCLFEADCEVVTYSSLEECLEKVEFLLTHHSARQEIALRGQRRTLRDHSALRRAEQLHELMVSLCH